jgi:hypothetical protein
VSGVCRDQGDPHGLHLIDDGGDGGITGGE